MSASYGMHAHAAPCSEKCDIDVHVCDSMYVLMRGLTWLGSVSRSSKPTHTEGQDLTRLRWVLTILPWYAYYALVSQSSHSVEQASRGSSWVIQLRSGVFPLKRRSRFRFALYHSVCHADVFFRRSVSWYSCPCSVPTVIVTTSSKAVRPRPVNNGTSANGVKVR